MPKEENNTSYIDNNPNLNIYDKIQILIYESYYEDIDKKIYESTLDNINNIKNDKNSSKPILIPKPNKNYFN